MSLSNSLGLWNRYLENYPKFPLKLLVSARNVFRPLLVITRRWISGAMTSRKVLVKIHEILLQTMKLYFRKKMEMLVTSVKLALADVHSISLCTSVSLITTGNCLKNYSSSILITLTSRVKLVPYKMLIRNISKVTSYHIMNATSLFLQLSI